MVLLFTLFLLTQNVKFLRIEVKDKNRNEYVHIEIPAQAALMVLRNGEGKIRIGDEEMEVELLDSLITCGEGEIMKIEGEDEEIKMFVYKRKYALQKPGWIRIKIEEFGKHAYNLNFRFPYCFLKFISSFISDKEDSEMLKHFLDSPFKGTIIKVESDDGRVYVSFE